MTVGDRALQARSAMSFIVENEIALVGMFPQNGFQTIKEGTALARTSALGGATVFPAELRSPTGSAVTRFDREYPAAPPPLPPARV